MIPNLTVTKAWLEQLKEDVATMLCGYVDELELKVTAKNSKTGAVTSSSKTVGVVDLLTSEPRKLLCDLIHTTAKAVERGKP